MKTETNPAESEPNVPLIQIRICQACLDGRGEECHTPGCALFLHKVDLPIKRDSYVLVELDEWIPIERAKQEPAHAVFLVTNSLDARTASDGYSHLWLVSMIFEKNDRYYAYTDSNQRIENLTHYQAIIPERARQKGAR